MTDIASPNAVIDGESSPVTFGEFWHLAPDDRSFDRSFAGPFTTKEAAQADAYQYLQYEGGRYNINSITIVKTVSVETNFHDV